MVNRWLAFVLVVTALGCGKETGGPTPAAKGGADTSPQDKAARGGANSSGATGEQVEEAAGEEGWTTRRTPLLSEGSPTPASPERYALAPGGQRWAYVAEKFGAQTMVVDCKQDSRSFPVIGTFGFSPDGRDFGYFVLHQEQGISDLQAYVNGGEPRVGRTPSEYPDPNDTSNNCLFATGTLAPNIRPRRGFLSIARKFRWIEAQGSQVVVDGAPVFRIDPETVFEPQFNASGTGHGFIVQLENEGYAVINGKPQRRFAKVWNLRIADDGKSWGHLAATDARKVFAIVNGSATPLENGTQPGWAPTFHLSPDGKRWAAVGEPVVVDGQPQGNDRVVPDAEPILVNGSPPGEPVVGSSFAFSPDSRSYAYVGVEQIQKPDFKVEVHHYVVRDGKRSRDWAAIAHGVLWSPDGRSLAYLAKSKPGDAWQVVRDDKPWPACDGYAVDAQNRYRLTFSSDGKRLATFGQRGVDWHAIIDGHVCPGHQQAPLGDGWAGFTSDGRLAYLARGVDGGVVLVEELPPGMSAADAAPLLEVAPSEGHDEGWSMLFDGSNVDRWTPEYFAKDWRIHDDVLEADKFGSLTSAGQFGNFHLRLECKHAEAGGAALITRAGQVVLNLIPSSAPGDQRTGTLIDVNSQYDSFPGGFLEDPLPKDTWFTLDLIVVGLRAVVLVDGEVITDRRLPEGTPEAGPIILSNISIDELAFRRIAIREQVDVGEFDAKR